MSRFKLTLLLISLLIFLLFLSGCSMINMIKKFNSGVADFDKDICVIPVDLYEHTMYVEVFINDNPNPYNFIFDTGAMTMMDKSVATELNLTKLSNLPGGDVDAYLIKEKCKIRMGDVAVKDFIIPAFDMPEAETGEPEIHGFIGSDFLQFFVVTVDYTQNTITFRKDINQIENLASAIEVPVELFQPLKFPMAECTFEDSFVTNSMFDTGSPFGMVLPLSILENEDFGLANELIEAEGNIIKWPYTDDTTNYLTRIRKLNLGPIEIKNFPVIFADLPMDLKHPLIGKEILDQFTVTLDFPNEKLYMKPIEDLSFKDNLYTTGLAIKEIDGSIFVKGFWKGSSVSKSGIKTGDKILSINSVTLPDSTINIHNDFLDNESVEEIELVVDQNGQHIEVIVKKEYIFRD